MKPMQILLAICFTSTISLAQQPLHSDTVLTVSGEVATPLQLTMAAIQKLPHRVVHAVDYDNHEYIFEGVDIYRILALAGIHFIDTLKGKVFASSVLVVRATDGYQAVFTLAELDPINSERPIILAFRHDGMPLSSKDGLLRIISPNEKRHIRWVRQVQSLIVQHIN